MSHSRRASECDGPSSPDSLVLGLNYTDSAAISAAVPIIIDEFGYSNAPFGLILSAFFWEYMPFNFLEGYTSNKFRPPWVMGLAVAWWSAFTAVTLMPLSATGRG